MSKSFNEAAKETRDKVKVSKNGKLKKTHSQTDFDRMAKVYLNDVDYETEFVKVKGGKPEAYAVNPVSMFRDTFLKKPLIDCGVDAQEAEAFARDYKYSKVDGLYEMITDFEYQYLTKCGKKIDFPTRMDFQGSISVDDVAASTKDYKAIGNATDPFTVETKEHKVIKSKSKAPKWVKKKFNK